MEEVVDDLRAGGVDQLGLLTEQAQKRRRLRLARTAALECKQFESDTLRRISMAMAVGGGSGGVQANINMTPMIDILAGSSDHLHGDFAY